MEKDFINVINKDSLINTAKESAKALSKKSKLRVHYLNMVFVNNVIRAFVIKFILDNSIKEKQLELLKTLCDIESRKNRDIFKNDIKVIDESVILYEDLLYSADEEQIFDIINFVNANNGEGSWIVTKHKN